MEENIPRILIAGTGSGCGKTTAVCAVLQALTDRGLRAAAFKCGPDYIDPMFHSRIIGAKSTNLDLFFFPENTANFLLAQNGRGCDIGVLEGVMGYYDGLGVSSDTASAYRVARATGTPAVLVVDGAGAALSALAVIAGFLDFVPDSGIRGVILNRCTAGTYEKLRPVILERFGGRVRPLGYLPRLPQCTLESRHLGLVTAAEVTDLREKMADLAAQAEQSLDLAGLLELAAQAPPVRCTPPEIPRLPACRIAVARDRAFCFYYADNLALLEALGAEIVPFSPLSDEALPQGIQGLYLGGGYPELYTRELSGNVGLRRSIARAIAAGLPCVAECGGFMYLTQSIAGADMAGALPGTCADAGRLTRFGYVYLEAAEDSLLFRAGERIPAHEFHRWDCTAPGDALLAVKPGGRSWRCAYTGEKLYAGFPHMHFYANPEIAARFVWACGKERPYHAGDYRPKTD